MEKQYSIKTKVFIVLLMLQIPLVLMVLLSNLYFVDFYNDSLADTNRNALDAYCKNLERELGHIDDRTLNFIASDMDYKMLVTTSGELDTHLHSLEVLSEYEKLMSENDIFYACFLIKDSCNLFREIYAGDSASYATKELLREYFHEYVREGGWMMERAWKPLVVNRESFLYTVRGYGGVYNVFILDVSQMDFVNGDDMDGLDGQIVLFDENQLLNKEELIQEGCIAFQGVDEYYFSGEGLNYLIIESPIAGTNIRAAYLMKYSGFFGSISVLQRTVVFLSLAIAICLVPAGYYILKKIFFQPMDSLMETMKSIRNGNPENRKEELFSDREFREINETFDDMMASINRLKIESYEKELDLQQTQLGYFQLQIRPHFYVNSLKCIYGLLENDRREEARQSIVCLSKHLRYMMKGTVMNVLLTEELQYVRNYIELQQMSMAYPVECEIEYASADTDFLIPAISILNFVENSIKYGMQQSKKLHIRICVEDVDSEEGKYLGIHISDDGKGFEDEILHQLNYGLMQPREGHFIGIYNVMRRFELFYGKDNLQFAFSNLEGAHTDIYIKETGKGECIIG